MLELTACHQSCGCCSDHSGRGVERLSDVVAVLTTSPWPSMISAFAPVVLGMAAVLASRWAHDVVYHDVHVATLRLPMVGAPEAESEEVRS